MMYLSGVENSDLILAIELNNDFLSYLRDILAKLTETKLNFKSVLINFDSSKARLIERGFDHLYEDTQIRETNNGESFLDYHGFYVSKYCFPTDNYWNERKPNEVYLVIRGNHIGFMFKHDTDMEISGVLLNISQWEKFLK